MKREPTEIFTLVFLGNVRKPYGSVNYTTDKTIVQYLKNSNEIIS